MFFKLVTLFIFLLLSVETSSQSNLVSKDTVLDIVKNRRLSVSRVPYTYLGSREVFLAEASKMLATSNYGEEMTYYYKIEHGGNIHNIYYDIETGTCNMITMKSGVESQIAKLSDQGLECYEKFFESEDIEASRDTFDKCVKKVNQKSQALTQPSPVTVNTNVCEELYGKKLQ